MPRQRHRRQEVRARLEQKGTVDVDPEHHPLQQSIQPKRSQATSLADHSLQAAHVRMIQLRQAKHGFIAGHFGHGADDGIAVAVGPLI